MPHLGYLWQDLPRRMWGPLDPFLDLDRLRALITVRPKIFAGDRSVDSDSLLTGAG